jgi:hypothetical protein
MSVPDPSDTVVNTSLLMAWGVINVFGVLMHLFLMIVTTMLYIAVLQVSAHEGPEDVLEESDCYSDTNQNGVVMTEKQFFAIWLKRYEPWFKQIIRLFSWGAAVFFATMIPTAHVRYFMNAAAAWIQVGALVIALLLWWRIHSAIAQSLKQLRGIKSSL